MSGQVCSLSFRDLTIGYGKGRSRREVSRSLSGDLCAGSLVALFGNNGRGKSTLLRTLAGLLPPLEGEVLICGVAARQLSRAEFSKNVAVVLTQTNDTAFLTAYEVVAMGRQPYTGLSGILGNADRRICEKALESVGATHLAQKTFRQLSDGEKQRVMIAKALAQDTPVVLLDEPTAFLDYPSRLDTTALLRRLAHEGGKAILFSSHDVEMASSHADRVWVLAKDHIENMQPADFNLKMLYEQQY